jgi:hypothetical protein
VVAAESAAGEWVVEMGKDHLPANEEGETGLFHPAGREKASGGVPRIILQSRFPCPSRSLPFRAPENAFSTIST